MSDMRIQLLGSQPSSPANRPARLPRQTAHLGPAAGSCGFPRVGRLCPAMPPTTPLPLGSCFPGRRLLGSLQLSGVASF